MTLSETANFLDRQQRENTPTESNLSAIGQVMVAISSRGPDAGKLLRKTARLAAQLNGNWYAVYVRTPEESAITISAEDQRRVTDTLETAQKMGGMIILLKGEDVAQALVAFAREYGITHIVVGRPGRKKPWKFLRPHGTISPAFKWLYRRFFSLSFVILTRACVSVPALRSQRSAETCRMA